tara:strand:+ start:2439 stop:3815 length:1377 start_codon:yes stop_codon:yes gene_type:complete
MAVSGSIKYELTNGNNLRSFPFETVSGSNAQISTPALLQQKFANTSSLLRIITEGGAAQYLTGSQEWVGSLTTIKATQGYWLNVSGTVEFAVTGTLIPSNFSRPTSRGNNLVANPFTTTLPVTEVLNDISGSNFKQMIGQGEAASVNTSGNWVGSLSNVTPGKAYWITNTFTHDGLIEFQHFKQTASLPPEPNTTQSWDYIKCTDGEDCVGMSSCGKHPTLGNDSQHTEYWKQFYGDNRAVHTFGMNDRQMSQWTWIMTVDHYWNTASLQDASGNEISHSIENGPPIISWWVTADSGSQSGSLMIPCSTNFHFSGEQEKYWASKGYTNIYDEYKLTNADLQKNQYYPAHTSQSWLMFNNVYYDDGTDNSLYGDPRRGAGWYPNAGARLYPRVYDPVRNRVYKAKVYNRLNAEVHITSSAWGTFQYLLPLSASLSSPNPHHEAYGPTGHYGWCYIKTVE